MVRERKRDQPPPRKPTAHATKRDPVVQILAGAARCVDDRLVAEIPPAALPLMKNRPKLAGLAGLVRGRLFRKGAGLPGFEEWHDYLCEHGAIQSPDRRMLPHLYHFLLYGWSVMRPEWQDRDLLPTLPKLLSLLHYLVRTVRLFRKHQLSLDKRLA